MCTVGIKLKCKGCANHFKICVKCYRGHTYCSDECRIKVQRIKQKEASKRYFQTKKGRQKHAKRQRRYRLKKEPKSENNKNTETYETSVKSLNKLKVTQTLKQFCIACGTFVDQVFGGLREYFLATRQSYRSEKAFQH
jgi:hypothetical protein